MKKVIYLAFLGLFFCLNGMEFDKKEASSCSSDFVQYLHNLAGSRSIKDHTIDYLKRKNQKLLSPLLAMHNIDDHQFKEIVDLEKKSSSFGHVDDLVIQNLNAQKMDVAEKEALVAQTFVKNSAEINKKSFYRINNIAVPSPAFAQPKTIVINEPVWNLHTPQEQAFIIAHEYRHIKDKHLSTRRALVSHLQSPDFENNDTDPQKYIDNFFKLVRFQEKEADIKACLHNGPQICKGGIESFIKFKEILKDEVKQADIQHPSLEKRIDYLTQLSKKLEKEEQGYVYNPPLEIYKFVWSW